MKTPKTVKIQGTNSETTPIVLELSYEQYCHFMEWKMAQDALPYVLFKLGKSVKEGTAYSEENKQLLSFSLEISELNLKMLESGIFKDKYYFDRTWTELN